VTLQELWRGGNLRLGAYITKDATEPLVRAFQQWADSALAYADYATAKQQPRPQADRDTILQTLVDLVKVSDDDDPRRDVRSRQTVLGLQQGSADRERLIHDLIAARLLTSPAEDSTVDIIHEALIRTWEPLRTEIQRQRRLLRQRRRFEEDLQLWRTAPDEDKHNYLLSGVRLEGALEIDPRDIAMLGDDARALLANSLEWRAREQRERFMPAIVQSLAAHALRQQAGFFNDERAALLARQAYLFGQTTTSPVQDQSDDALRTVLNKPYFSTLWERDAALALAFSSDGCWLAASGFRGITLLDRSQPGADPVELFTLGQQDAVIEMLAFSPDGSTLAAGRNGNQVCLWNMRQLDAEPRTLSIPMATEPPAPGSDPGAASYSAAVQALAFSPDGRMLASSDEKIIHLWDLSALDVAPRSLAGHEDALRALAFSPDGRFLASSDEAGAIRLWDLSALDAAPRSLAGHKAWVEALAFSPDGQALVSCGYDGTLRRWDLQKLDQKSQVVFTYTAPALTLAFSPDGNILATGSDNNLIRLWDWRQLDATPAILQGHRSPVLTLAFSPDGQTLASGANNEPVRLWDMRPSGSDAIVLPGSGLRVSSVALSLDNQWLAAGAYEEVGLWNLQRLDAPAIMSEHSGLIFAVAFSPDGQALVVGDEQALRFWDLTKATPTAGAAYETGFAFEAVGFSPDNRMLAAGGRDSIVRVWEGDAQEPIELTGHEGAITAVAFSPDSQMLASCAEDSTIRVWKILALDAAPLVLASRDATALSLAFSPDGRTLAAACRERTVALWNFEQPEAAPRLLRGHEAKVGALAFSPDGRMLASGGDDATVRLWDLQNHDARTVLAGHKVRIVKLAFSGDSTMLLSCDESLHLHTWPVYTNAIADQICARVSRNLTYREWQDFVGKDIPYERTCPSHPVHPSVRYAAQTLAATNFAEAVGLLRRVAELDPTLEMNPEAEAHEAAARSIAESGRLADVLARLEAARAADPQRDPGVQIEILLYTGLACAYQGQADDAVKAFHSAQALKPGAEIPAEAWERLCIHLIDVAKRTAAENIAGALALLRRAAELAPTLKLNPEAEAHEAAAMTIAESGRLAEVLAHIEAVRAAAPRRDPSTQRHILLKIGFALVGDGQVADAVKALDAAQALQPDVPLEVNEMIWLCWLGSLAGHADLVLFAGDRAVTLDPENFETYDTRGVARALSGDLPGAIEDFTIFIKRAKGIEGLAKRVALRKRFIAALRKGRNPFDEETIEQLRRE
jgi:WD40 repeat protein/tetratricopeptide (TPR) repeat protein